VLYLKCIAQSVELTLEFCTIVCPYLCWVPKDLKNLFFHCVRDRITAFVVQQGENTELAETTNGAQHVHTTISVPQVDD